MTPISLVPEKVETIVLACCSLHNFLSETPTSQGIYIPQESIDREDSVTHSVISGEWQQQQQPQGLVPIERQGSNRHSNAAKEVRDNLCSYFNSKAGSVPWQNNLL